MAVDDRSSRTGEQMDQEHGKTEEPSCKRLALFLTTLASFYLGDQTVGLGLRSCSRELHSIRSSRADGKLGRRHRPIARTSPSETDFQTRRKHLHQTGRFRH